jgi:oligopeptide transport system ATP-binding protein
MGRLLEVEDLQVRFNTPEGVVHAVNGISYHLDEGETLAVVGESGCGKSVSVMSILGLIPIPPGEILKGSARFRNVDLLQLSESELEHVRGAEIAMIFQDPMTSLNPVLTIGLQITESLIIHLNMDSDEANARAAELLELTGFSQAAARLGDYPHQFSGGMRQRAMISMALGCSPSLLIADEPTTALDVTIQAQIVELALNLRDQLGMAIIWITHDLGVVARMADRVLVMYAGYIMEEASVFDLYKDPRHPYSLMLLSSLPRVDQRRSGKLRPIPGSPPSMLTQPKGCPFAPRCSYVLDRCREVNPPLEQIAPGRQVACWVNLEETK